jgi:hypothetical protein
MVNTQNHRSWGLILRVLAPHFQGLTILFVTQVFEKGPGG